jgi:hypothetical protein
VIRVGLCLFEMNSTCTTLTIFSVFVIKYLNDAKGLDKRCLDL